ncbi:MAG: glycosyltransferase family 2 protein [Methylosarcina sp.]
MINDPSPEEFQTRLPLISIVVAVYNGREVLQQCVDSIASQTYKNKELIVIDGGSKDGTVDLLMKNQDRIGYWLSEPDKGIYNAWNKALPRVRGEWICFLGADDFFWDTTVLEGMSKHLQKLPSAVRVAYGRLMILDSDGKELYPLGQPWPSIKDRFKHSMCIPHPGVMHRKSLFEQHGQFDESFRIAADYELLLRELPMAEAFFAQDLIVVGMRQGGISSTASNLWLALGEIRRAQRMHGHTAPWHLKFLALTSVLLRLFLLQLFGEARVTDLINWSKRITKR